MPHLPPRQALSAAILLFAGLAGVVIPMEASAQAFDVSNRTAVLSSASLSMTSTVVGGVIVSVTINSGSAGLETYLRQNAVALHHDIARGAGPTVADLAEVFGVASADLTWFGKRLRARRAELGSFVLDVNPATAKSFAQVVFGELLSR